jgi:hypothetical protein
VYGVPCDRAVVVPMAGKLQHRSHSCRTLQKQVFRANAPRPTTMKKTHLPGRKIHVLQTREAAQGR